MWWVAWVSSCTMFMQWSDAQELTLQLQSYANVTLFLGWDNINNHMSCASWHGPSQCANAGMHPKQLLYACLQCSCTCPHVCAGCRWVFTTGWVQPLTRHQAVASHCRGCAWSHSTLKDLSVQLQAAAVAAAVVEGQGAAVAVLSRTLTWQRASAASWHSPCGHTLTSTAQLDARIPYGTGMEGQGYETVLRYLTWSFRAPATSKELTATC